MSCIQLYVSPSQLANLIALANRNNQDGFPYVFLCFGDVACYYDAKKTPGARDALPLWPFRWGSQQMGITPGHIQLQLMWKKLGDLPGKAKTTEVLGPRVQISEGVQMPLMGKKERS